MDLRKQIKEIQKEVWKKKKEFWKSMHEKYAQLKEIKKKHGIEKERKSGEKYHKGKFGKGHPPCEKGEKEMFKWKKHHGFGKHGPHHKHRYNGMPEFGMFHPHYGFGVFPPYYGFGMPPFGRHGFGMPEPEMPPFRRHHRRNSSSSSSSSSPSEDKCKKPREHKRSLKHKHQHQLGHFRKGKLPKHLRKHFQGMLYPPMFEPSCSPEKEEKHCHMKEGFPHSPFQDMMPHYDHHFWKFMKHGPWGPCLEKKHEKEGKDGKVVHNVIKE